ncbi:unnamed protein product, partial [Effrenium voratum]
EGRALEEGHRMLRRACAESCAAYSHLPEYRPQRCALAPGTSIPGLAVQRGLLRCAS